MVFSASALHPHDVPSGQTDRNVSASFPIMALIHLHSAAPADPLTQAPLRWWMFNHIISVTGNSFINRTNLAPGPGRTIDRLCVSVCNTNGCEWSQYQLRRVSRRRLWKSELDLFYLAAANIVALSLSLGQFGLNKEKK